MEEHKKCQQQHQQQSGQFLKYGGHSFKFFKDSPSTQWSDKELISTSSTTKSNHHSCCRDWRCPTNHHQPTQINIIQANILRDMQALIVQTIKMKLNIIQGRSHVTNERNLIITTTQITMTISKAEISTLMTSYDASTLPRNRLRCLIKLFLTFRSF